MNRVLLLALSLPATLLAQSKGPRPGTGLTTDEIERQIRMITEAKDPTNGNGRGAANGYGALFRGLGAEEVRELQSHKNDAIAVWAAWEQVAAGRHSREWFVGFLQGRTRFEAPEWWSAMFVNGLPRPSGATKNDARRPIEEPYESTGLDYIRAPKGTGVARDLKEDGVLIVRVGEETVRIPENLFTNSTTGKIVGSVSALVRPDRCYLAVHEDVGYPYELLCLDRKAGKVVWKSDVFSHFWGTAFGRHAMYVAVTQHRGQLVLYGASWAGFHVEAFRAADGANLFRYSTGNQVTIAK
jgi:hypothetical protein